MGPGDRPGLGEAGEELALWAVAWRGGSAASVARQRPWPAICATTTLPASTRTTSATRLGGVQSRYEDALVDLLDAGHVAVVGEQSFFALVEAPAPWA